MKKSAQEPQALRPLLSRIGLDPREVEVYLALLPMKIARASVIATKAKQSRSHTYLVLRSLELKGLVSEIERGKVLHFVAEDPRNLLSYIDDREAEFRSLKPIVEGALPMLESLTSPLIGKPRVTMLSGMEGMKQVYREALQHEFVAFFNPLAMYETFGGNVMHSLFGKQTTFRGKDLLVRNKGTQRYLTEMSQDDQYHIRVLPRGIDFSTDTVVFGDVVSFFAYDDESTIVRMENKNLADAFRAWHAGLWNSSTEE